MKLKFAANLNFLFTEAIKVADRIKLAHKNGFRAIEINYPDDEINDVLLAKEATDIHVVLVNLAFDKRDERLLFGTASIPGEGEKFQEQLLKTIDFAKAVNCPKIHLTAGIVGCEDVCKHLATYKTNLKIAAKHLKKECLMGLIEPINKYAVPKYFMNSYGSALDVLNEVNEKNIKLMNDVFHMQHICGNITYVLKDLQHLIGHIQIAQVPSRNEPDSCDELDFSYLFGKFEEMHYNDWIGCEYKPSTTTVDGLKWLRKYNLKL